MSEQRSARMEATAVGTGELLHAPASGTECVAWRMRVVERVTGGLELVHDVASTDPFELIGRSDEQGDVCRMRIEPETMELEGTPVLFRDGSPAIDAVRSSLGLQHVVRVEEVVLRPGDVVETEGVLESGADAAGPYRASATTPLLLEPTLRLPSQRPALGSTLLPWVLGTAAVALAALGAGAYGLSRLMVRAHHPQVDEAAHSSQVMGPQQPARPRFP